MIICRTITKLKRGTIVVLTTTEKNIIKAPAGESLVFFMGKGFPMKEFQNALNEGQYTAREATPEEKEFCYYCIDTLDKPGGDMETMQQWREQKSTT